MKLALIEAKVKDALKTLRRKDNFLLKKNVNERTISHRLAIYLEEEFGKDFDVDCEYNKLGDEVKRITPPEENIEWNDLTAKTVYPDILIHKRGTHEKNLLIIEIKKSSNNHRHKFDREKLKCFKENSNFAYKFALFLIIGVGEISEDKLEFIYG